MSGQEERDVLFARLFGLTAVINSGLIVRAGSLATSASSAPDASSSASYQEAVVQLVALGEKKSWLRESAWWTIALAVDALSNIEVSWKEDAVAATIQTLFVENKSWSPEKIALALKLQKLYADKDWKKMFAPVFKSSNILGNANLQTLARILKVRHEIQLWRVNV